MRPLTRHFAGNDSTRATTRSGANVGLTTDPICYNAITIHQFNPSVYLNFYVSVST